MINYNQINNPKYAKIIFYRIFRKGIEKQIYKYRYDDLKKRFN